MQVTKSEVKKASKKVLSVILAVVMVISTMSVCFGTLVFAAGKDVDVTALANALKYDSIKNASFSGSANKYTVSDPDGKILAAVEAYFTVVDAMANKNPSVQTPSSGTSDISQTGESSDKTYRTINHLNARVKTLLQSAMGSDYSTYKVDAFLTGLLAGASISEGTTMKDGSASETNNTSVPATPLSAAPDIQLTVMMESAVTGYTLDTLPDSVVTSKVFTVKHANTNYDYRYDYTAATSGCSSTPAKYEHDYWFYYNYSSYSESNGASKSTQTIKNTAATLEQYADYFTMGMDGLCSTPAATLNTVKSAVTTAKQNVVLDFGAGVFTHFFSAYNVETLKSDIDLAIEIQGMVDNLQAAYDKMNEGYDSIITDKAALIALSQTMKAGIDTYNAASSGAKAYVTSKGFIIADITAYYNAVLREIELIEIRELVAEIEVGIAPYIFYTEEGIDEGTVTSAMIGNALTTVNGYQTRLNKYDTADVDAVNANVRSALLEVKNTLNYLATVAGYNDRFSAEYAKFASEIFSVTDANGDIDTLLSALKNYDSWYTGLKNLIAEMKSVLGEELADKLFDDLNDVMTARMDDAYVALNALLEAQIDYAYDLFKAFIADGETITMANVSQYNKMKASIGLINVDAYNFLKGESAHFRLSQEAINKYNEMQRDFPTYQEFLNSHGFSSYQQTTISDLERADTIKDIARENEGGIYKTSDADIEKIIELLDALLQNDQVKALLGDLINKDEDGNPTGEPFDLAALINGLLEGIYTDDLINTIVQYVYPIVAKEFAKVWAGLPATIQINGIPVNVSFINTTADVVADLSLYDVETAIAAVGVFLSPTTLAKNLQNSYGKNSGEYAKYTEVISVLSSVTTKAVYNKNGDGDEDDTFQNPWEDAKLFEYVFDEETGEQLYNDDGTPKTKYKLNWGIDEAEDKRAAFIDAACAALSGLEPLLFGILTNKTQANANDSDSVPRGHKIGTGSGDAKVSIATLDLTIDPITLVLKFGGNDGYDNALAPIFEALGLENIPHGEDLTTTRKILEDGLFGMIDQLIEKVAEAPVTFILEALPNLCYALEGGLVKPLLNMLRTEINYYADAYYDCNVYNITHVTGNMADAMKSEEPILINLGEMINLDDMGLDIGSFQAIWDMIAGGVELLNGIDAPDAGKIATMGKLVEKATNRSAKTYNHGSANKAYHIEANKADVLLYLLQYVLGSGLLDKLELPAEGFVADLMTGLKENTDIILAAVVELLNQKEYDTLREYEWFNGLINNESVVGNSAYEIYMNPGNDWTKDKAEYLYNNLDALVASILVLANVDLDDTTEDVDGSIGTVIDGAIGGLLSDKTLTSLASLLAMLDLNALLAPKADEEAGKDANAPGTVAEGEEEEEAAALDLDVNALVKEFLGIDLAAIAAKYAPIAEALELDPEYVHDFGVDEGTTTFAAALTEMLKPLKSVLDFILAGENLVITVEGETVELIGYDGYNNAIIPILEALGCDVKVNPENALEATLTALLGKIDSITKSDEPIKAIIDLLPGVFYFIASKGLSVSVRNLLQPVYVILDTIRPIFDLNLNETINGLLPEDFGIMLNIDDIGLEFIFDLLKKFVPDLDLSALKDVIYDICLETASEYDSVSTLQTEWKKGAYSEDFDQADLLTVVLSFVLEWATIADNAAKLDEMLGTNGLISAIGTVFESVEIIYGTPDWYYWFDDEAAFSAYLAGDEDLPNTLYALEYPNDWTQAKAEYVAANLPALVDTVIGLINAKEEDAPATLSALLNGLIAENINAETLNGLVAMIADLLGDIDANLIETAGYILDVDLAGLLEYECTAEIDSLSDFINELADVLDTYAGGLINWLFFGDDYRFAKKSDKTDTIVINGGLGYEKGLALVLEALGCELPAEANVKSVLGALATRVDAILAAPVDEVIGLLPNLIYFLNANGAGVAVSNLLAPVNALLAKINGMGILENPIVIADLLKFTLEDGTEIAVDPANLALADVVEILKKVLPGFDFSAVEDYLVNFCTGKITKGKYIYKMEAPKADVVTIVLTIALTFVKNETNGAKLDEMLGTEFLASIDEVLKGTPVEYLYPDYNYFNGEINVDEGTIEVIESAITYPNDWTEEKAAYLAENLDDLVDIVVGMVSEYDSLSALLGDKVNVFTTETLNSLVGFIGGLLGNVDDELLEFGCLLDVDLVGLKAYTAPEGIETVDAFAAELANVLNTYAKGVVEWLLLGDDIKLFVTDVDTKGEKLEGEDIITINGANGYSEGLALILEALGCENLPAADGETETIVSGVLASLAARINEIFADPVNEAIELLPNLIYFLNANGVATSVNNLAGAFNALALKLKTFGLNITLDDLVNIEKLCGIDKELEIGLDNLTIPAILELVSELTGLDLSKLEDVLAGFALGKVTAYESVSSLGYTAKMEFADEFDKHDMITVLVTAALLVAFETEGNEAVINEMIGDDIIAAIKAVFEDMEIEYVAPDWDYALADNGTVDAMKYSITYPNNWKEATAKYVADNLPEIGDLIAGLIDGNYDSLSALLKDKVNVFTTENLQAIVDLIAGLLGDIDDGLLDAAGVLLGADVVGLKAYKAPEGIATADAFAAELANVLNTYAKGLVEWLLLGEDYRFFVKAVDEEGLPVDFITLNGAYGYTEGLALLLEALGCENLPAVTETTEDIVTGVLASVAELINKVLEAPVETVVEILPNVLYFLNANGVAAVIDNTIAALTALLEKLAQFGIKLDINELVNLKSLMGLKDTDAAISLDNLSMAAILEAVSLMTGLDLTLIEDVLVGFALGEVNEYDSVSVSPAYKMTYADEFDKHDMVTVLANLVILTIADKNNEEFVKGLVGEDVYEVIDNICNEAVMPVKIQDFEWLYTDIADTDAVISALETSEIFESGKYGPLYTEEMAKYIAENFGMFVDNIIYLLGININGNSVDNLKELINGLLNGNLYNSANVIAIRDALAGVLAGIEGLEVNGKNVGKYIAEVLKNSEVADISAVAKVEIPEFTENREMFVTYLCDVLEPLYPVLEWALANQNIEFFIDLEKTAAIELVAGEGYAYGIIPLLEVLECEGILSPDEYYEAVKADGDVVITSILDPLLNRIDEILAEDPAGEILDMLPNIIYFLNSNGVDTVVRNTLHAVYGLLNAISPIAEIDLYEIIGIDLADINFEWLFAKVLEIVKDSTGYEFSNLDASAVCELSIGTVESYTSLNGKTAYKMVYVNTDDITGGKAEMATVIMRLLITFVMHENNQEMLLGLLRDYFGMTPEAEKYIAGVLYVYATAATETYLGMDQALATTYYLYYGADIGVSEMVGGFKDLNLEWQKLLKELGYSDDENATEAGKIIAEILGLEIFDDIISPEGIAPNGLIAFFEKVVSIFTSIIEWLKAFFA